MDHNDPNFICQLEDKYADKFQHIDSRFDKVDARFDKLEGKIDSFLEISASNSADISWLKGITKISLTMIITAISSVVAWAANVVFK